jgi:hypothetical protein
LKELSKGYEIGPSEMKMTTNDCGGIRGNFKWFGRGEHILVRYARPRTRAVKMPEILVDNNSNLKIMQNLLER